MYEYLKKVNGIALFNDKDPLLTEMIYKYVNRAVPYSDPAGFPLTLKPEHEGINLSLDVSYNYTTFKLNTNLFGGYNLWNVKAAIATGLFFEVDIKEIVSAIGEYHPSNNRSQVKITRNNTLICDSYNANPSSMHSALVSFASINDKPLLVILGDMLELGGDSELEHRRIVDEIDVLGIKNVYLTGKIFKKAAAEKGFRAFSDVEALSDQLKKEPVSGYTILIKGSRGIGLERIYDLL
jgi:UDP-N-acetylmuramoyl-tripeptide--D-alanyl-D-alanine ligase